MATFLYQLKPQAQHVNKDDSSGDDSDRDVDADSDDADNAAIRPSNNLFAE